MTTSALTSTTPTTGTTAPSSTVSNPGSTLSKDDFLKLLVTQLRYQDPMNPLDQNQFLSQTAQFTSLEDLQNISAGLDTLNANATASSLTQAASLLGHTAQTSGGRFAYDGLSSATLPFTLTSNVSGATIQVLDAKGSVINSLTTGPLSAGSQSATWDGLDNNGNRVPAGTYAYRVSSTGDTSGAPQAFAASGIVSGVTLQNGQLMYRIGNSLFSQGDIVAVA